MAKNLPPHPDYPYYLACGDLETMQRMSQRGYRKLNTKTMRWQTVSKTARYKIKALEPFKNDEGQEFTPAELWSNENLDEIAKQKGLI